MYLFCRPVNNFVTSALNPFHRIQKHCGDLQTFLINPRDKKGEINKAQSSFNTHDNGKKQIKTLRCGTCHTAFKNVAVKEENDNKSGTQDNRRSTIYANYHFFNITRESTPFNLPQDQNSTDSHLLFSYRRQAKMIFIYLFYLLLF